MTSSKKPRQGQSSGNDNIIVLNANESPAISLYVGIGASAGGLEAIQSFFQQMPFNSSLAFIVIQHLSPDYKSLMVELLSKKTKIPVKRAEDGMKVEANNIYLIPPKKNLKIFHGKLLLSEQDHSRGINLPIDIFLHSLADDQGEKSAAVILSGTGSDGMRGIRAVKEQGGLVMVQSEQSAKFDGMPRAAISTGFADFVLPPEEMPDQLIAYAKHPYLTQSERSRNLLEDENGLTRIFSMLRERFKIDFTYYKPSTINRRIERRMTVNQIYDINDYAAFAQRTPSEISTLYRELLIGVTSFFRDPDAFTALMKQWLPDLLDHMDQQELRFWVAGCSTGEEAYSIAISVRECMEKLGITKDIKIFATDIDRDAVSKAGTGIYPESIAADVSPRLLAKYFFRKDENFHIARNIREMVVFAQHNLIKDPPFTQIDLVTCRNLLIYLQPVLQRKVLGFMNFSLRPGGILMLGLSETVGDMSDLFELVDNKHKIYRSSGRIGAGIERNHLLAPARSYSIDSPQRLLGGKIPRVSDDERTLQRFCDALAGDIIPLALIVNEQMEVQHIIGNTQDLIRLPSGRPVNDISKMVAKELSIPLATGVQKVYRTRKPHVFNNIAVSLSGQVQLYRMTIRPLPEKKGQESLVAVLLEQMAAPPKPNGGPEVPTYDIGNETQQYLRDMEQELQFTRENLQATIEELETANEELQATNEELLASNEELQSTNEELQSTNEELHTVNIEYQNKIIELTELNNDVENLLERSQVGKLLLDDNLEIRRFSAYIKKLFKILESDIGRPLTHLTHTMVDETPAEDVRTVMATKQMVEKEVRTEEGRWYVMRILPYQVAPDVYSGTVLSFMDITELKKGRDDLEHKNRQYKLLFDAIGSGVVVYRAVDQGADFEIVDLNKAAEKIENVDRRTVIGRKVGDVFPGVAAFGLLDIFRQVWRSGDPGHHPATRYEDGRIEGWRRNQVFKLPSGEIVAVYDDVTREKEAEASLQLSQREKTLLLNSTSEVVLHLGLDRRINWLSAGAAEAIGEKMEALIGRECHRIWHTDEQSCRDCPFSQAVETKEVSHGTATDGKGRLWQITANPVLHPCGEVFGVVETRRLTESEC